MLDLFKITYPHLEHVVLYRSAKKIILIFFLHKKVIFLHEYNVAIKKYIVHCTTVYIKCIFGTSGARLQITIGPLAKKESSFL